MPSWKVVKQKLVAFYNIPFVHGLVAAIEGGAFGAIADAGIEPSEVFTKHGLTHLYVAMATGVAIAIRNYLKNNRAAALSLAAQALKDKQDPTP